MVHPCELWDGRLLQRFQQQNGAVHHGQESPSIRLDKEFFGKPYESGDSSVTDLLIVKCKSCGDGARFETHKKHPNTRALAKRAGWVERAKGWMCQKCRREEPDEGKEA